MLIQLPNSGLYVSPTEVKSVRPLPELRVSGETFRARVVVDLKGGSTELIYPEEGTTIDSLARRIGEKLTHAECRERQEHLDLLKLELELEKLRAANIAAEHQVSGKIKVSREVPAPE